MDHKQPVFNLVACTWCSSVGVRVFVIIECVTVSRLRHRPTRCSRIMMNILLYYSLISSNVTKYLTRASRSNTGTDNGAILTSSRRKQCFVTGDLSSFQSLESSEESKEKQTRIRLLWVEIRMLSSYRDRLRREYAEAERDKDADETLQRVLHRRIELLRGMYFCFTTLRKNTYSPTHRYHSITSKGCIGR